MNGARVEGTPVGMDELRACMTRSLAWRAHRLEWVESVGSTNEELKTSDDMRLLVAGYQTAGRGQRGRAWTAAPGTGLLFSFSWVWPTIDSAWEIPLRTGLAVRTALGPFAGGTDRLWLKWPNDICLDDGKLGGILVESTARGDGLRLVVGIGINLRDPGLLAEEHEADSRMRPAALTECGEVAPEADRWAVLCAFVRSWANQMDLARSGGDALRAAFIDAAGPFWGRNVRVALGDGETVEGRAISLAAGGALEILEKNGGHRLVTDARRLSLVGEWPAYSPVTGIRIL